MVFLRYLLIASTLIPKSKSNDYMGSELRSFHAMHPPDNPPHTPAAFAVAAVTAPESSLEERENKLSEDKGESRKSQWSKITFVCREI